MTDIPAIARAFAESMTEAQRIDYTKQQCVPTPDWMLQQCCNITQNSQIVNPT